MEIRLISTHHGKMCNPRFMSTLADVRAIQSAFFRIALGSLALSAFGISFQKSDTVARLLMEVIEWRYYEEYQRG